jgi:hypothetical protein
MKTLKLIGMVPLVLISATAFSQSDNQAVPRSGGSSSHSDAGSRHTGGSSSGGSSSASSDSGSRGGSSASSGGGQYDSSRPGAASRRPRPGTGTGTRDRYGNDRDRYTSYPYSYYYYDPYAYSWGYPRRSYGLYGYGYGYYDYGYAYGDYYGYSPYSYGGSYRYRSGNVAQIRTLVEPSKARVYVDGYYAGVVDDFDGFFQRLNVSPGRHDITFKLEGYTTHTMSVYAAPDQTLKLRWDMVRGGGETRDSVGEANERRPDRDLDRARDRDIDREAERDREPPRDRSREVDMERPDRAPAPPAPPGRSGRGEVFFEIQPLDASVYVDGEFSGKASQVTRLELSPGRHRIEVVRPGYRTEETEIDVEGEAKKVVVRLERR